jgi:hypothetical protein
MRLAQLARKLSVRPSEIVDLLAQNQVFFEDGSNAKLNDDQVRSAVLHFAPDRLSEIMLVQASEVNELESQQETTREAPIEDKTESISEVLNPATTAETSEIIRAQKVELVGLKVLGKIELPQSRLKETSTDEVNNPNEVKPKRERREKQPRRDREDRSWRNPIAQQRETEAREREERRLEALKQEKERKRLNYLNKVKNSKPPKAARIYDEVAVVPTKVHEQKPRTWVGKFLRWLNT